MAFLTLFRIATGDNWNGIMKVCNLINFFIIIFFYNMNDADDNWGKFEERRGRTYQE